MACLITLEHPCSVEELEAIRCIDEGLEPTEHEPDTRESLGGASLILGEVPGGLGASLLGTIEGRQVCFTVIGPTVWSIKEMALRTMCKIFKVDELPF